MAKNSKNSRNSGRLKVAMIAPPWFEIPPSGYGGIEAMCAVLTDGLVNLGHEVTVISAGANGTRGQHVQTYATPQWERIGGLQEELFHIAAAARALDRMEVDIVHNHSLGGSLLARGLSVPTVSTLHGPLTDEPGDYYRLFEKSASYIALSDSQRSGADDINWCATVPNGVQVADYTYRAQKEEWALFLGRCTPDKGMHLAIDIARAAGMKIRLAAKCNEPPEKEYFKTEIAPRLDADVEWLGEVHGHAKTELLSRAKCLLFPILWEEPFGLVMIEALASGTPVLALRRGSVPEVVEHGVTGIICDTAEQLTYALKEVSDIDPRKCREAAVRRFDASVMAMRYEAAYRDLIAR
ncbi:glycosyltransferase family 4 protein [Streptomyces sp. NPDC056672]|uniref:glycosyltransferase family 4 protein n=1 Tax=Streptomyces sp. NPDC056672 TaxID=3345906 RepID=UPI0036C2D036